MLKIVKTIDAGPFQDGTVGRNIRTLTDAGIKVHVRASTRRPGGVTLRVTDKADASPFSRAVALVG